MSWSTLETIRGMRRDVAVKLNQQSGLHCPYLVVAVRLDRYIQLGSRALAVPGLTRLVNLVRWKISRVHCFQVLHLPPDLLDPLAQAHDRAQYWNSREEKTSCESKGKGLAKKTCCRVCWEPLQVPSLPQKAATGALPQVQPSSQFEGAARQKMHSLHCLCFLSWLQIGNLSIQARHTLYTCIHADVAVLIAIAPLTPVFQCCVFPWQHVSLSTCDVSVSHASYICIGRMYIILSAFSQMFPLLWE